MNADDFTSEAQGASYAADMSEPPATVVANASTDRSVPVADVVRQRYHLHLATAFSRNGFRRADALADLALDTLTDWRNVETGAVCRCNCHPQLPTNDRHDYGFDCMCMKTREQRKHIYTSLRQLSEAYWESVEGRRIAAAKRAEDADLQEWLATQPDVTAHRDGDFAPEAWRGEVAGHSFYFRERGGQWSIELDLRPSGWFVQTVVAVEATGKPRIEPREAERGDVIASGDTSEDGYGTTARERVQFIVGKIRQHLARVECAHHIRDLAVVEVVLGEKVRWCPACRASLGG